MIDSEYKKIYIYYFSGTGNARNTAYWIAETAEKTGLEYSVISLEKEKEIIFPEDGNQSLIGFCSPTHGFNLPPIVLNFMFRFPKNRAKDVFFVNTRGGTKFHKAFFPGLSGIAQFLPAIVFLFKGYRIVGMKPIDLPSNWISIHPGLWEKTVNAIYARCKRKTIDFTEKILKGRKVYSAFWSLPIDLAISPIALAYYLVGRFMLAKTFIANSDCNKCNLCVKQCPTQSIEFKNDIPYWSFNCESCMRCMNICPERAIQTSHGSTILIWYVLMAILLPFFVGLGYSQEFISVDKGSFVGWLFENGIFVVLSFLFLFVVYRLQHFLLRFRLFNKLISLSSLTYYKLWNRYKAPRKY